MKVTDFINIRSEDDEIMRNKLLEVYPDGCTKNIITLDFYDEFKRSQKISKLNRKDYIVKKLGLNYFRNGGVFSVENIEENLINCCPNKIIDNLVSFHENNSGLYLSIGIHCKNSNISIVDYLKKLGYTVKTCKYTMEDTFTDDSEFSYSDIDVYNLKKLIKEYTCVKSSIALFVNLKSKQSLDSRLGVKWIDPPSWNRAAFTEEEITLIVKTLSKREVIQESSDGLISLNIYFGKDSIEDIAILVKNNNIFKCHFKFSGVVKEKLIEFGYLSHNDIDFKILRDIRNLNTEGESLKFTSFNASENSSLYSRINKRRLKLDISVGDYLNTLGVEYLKENLNVIYTIDVIKDILKSYADEDNFVNVPIGDKMYDTLKMLPKRNGYTTYTEMIKALGFNYKRGRIENSERRIMDYEKILKEDYIVYDNKVYIHSLDNLYGNLSSYCTKRNIKLEEYLSSIGLERIDSYKDLPIDYIPYDWKEEQRKKLLNLDVKTKIALMLESFSDEDNNVCVESRSSEYSYLDRISTIKDISITTLIESYGYTRVFKNRVNGVSIEVDKSVFGISEDEKEQREKYLEELEAIQNSGPITELATIEKQKRNATLSDKLKKLYSRRCQICSTEDIGLKIPIIEDEKGKRYVEMHHIQNLSEEVCDDLSLDTYKNGIVLCCYHHKYVHKHLGGFKELVKDRNNLFYLRSVKGKLLRIYTNYHLETLTTIEQIRDNLQNDDTKIQ
ncbi:hypothetical protein [Clostridium estertheticum]|uniref:HNH nuclease domain-containing protein n=1 Tax=Clostridium estertheticum subsp. estertheticum TaxID=1552 RepID=A0A1J0GIR0_9CLOT|nr:hypothetical protein [Clostridium estertheticum]APC40832.1 hypothetical protein A7L45_12495 [Clostridium estertheticum subsp. estertheticum]MBZ9617316.1 hypothetical protein [Clostridium estertheticum subsp. laramiense]WAG73003.1 hypothetical protein LL032_17895 [Clostridium estertheticum]